MSKGQLPSALRKKLMKRDGYKCRICGLDGRAVRFPSGGYGYYTAIPEVYLSIDHIFPRCRGGGDEPSNLRVLCTVCNTKKGRKFP